MNADRPDNADYHSNVIRGVSPLLVASGEVDDQISLREIVLRVWRGKWIVLLTALVIVAAVGAWMKMKDPRYTASMVVASAGEDGAGGLRNRLSQYSGIAALAGIGLPTGKTVTAFVQFGEILTSPVVAERLMRKYDIMPTVFEGSWTWDAENKTWVAKSNPIKALKGKFREFFGLPAKSPPTAAALADYLDRKLTISLIETTGMQRIEFQHKDPVFAVQLLAALHKEADNLIREESQTRTSRQIAYIERKLQTTTAADHRRSLVQLLLDQEKQMMMIQVDLPFAARVIEPPMASDQPTFPKPTLFFALALVGGSILGVFVVFLIGALRPMQGSRSAAETRKPRQREAAEPEADPGSPLSDDEEEKRPTVAAVNT